MRSVRSGVPVFGILALAVLFLKLPETPDPFGFFECKRCATRDPYFILIAAGYFATIVSISLLFPAFPKSNIARGGAIWALLLASLLTYLSFPAWCGACLIAHLCNILIWTIWLVFPSNTNRRLSFALRERACLTLFAPISIVALFSCLNLTFMAYRAKAKPIATTMRAGDLAPTFVSEASKSSGIIVNFTSPNCPYCKEQLPILASVATQVADSTYRFINVTSLLPSTSINYTSPMEWIEDKEGKLREQFKVTGYPTLFIIESDGKISNIIPGVPQELKTLLLSNLIKK